MAGVRAGLWVYLMLLGYNGIVSSVASPLPSRDYHFDPTNSVYTYRGALSRTILDVSCIRAYHQKFLGYATCDLPPRCGKVLEHDVATTWYGSRVHLCMGNTTWLHYPLVDLKFFNALLPSSKRSVPTHFVWATLIVGETIRYAFVPRTYEAHGLKTQLEKTQLTTDWSSLCIYESREDLLFRFLTEEAESSSNVLTSWTLRAKAFVPIATKDFGCSYQCTPLPYNQTHGFCNEALTSPLKYTSCGSVFALRPLTNGVYITPHVCMSLLPSETNVVTHYFQSLDVKHLLFSLIEAFLREICDMCVRVFDDAYPAFERLVAHLFFQLRPRFYHFINYAILLDRDYYILEYCVVFFFITYRSNLAAGILGVLLIFVAIGGQRHYPSLLHLDWSLGEVDY